MLPAADAIQLALGHHQAGRLDEAERIYRQILQADPRHADALHLLGVLAYQRGQHESAIAHIRSALGIQPGSAPFHNNLGLAYRAAHKLAEARACHEEALRLDSSYASAYANLGFVHREQSRLIEAVACYQQAIRVQPQFAEAHHGQGLVLHDMGKPAQALPLYDEALRLEPRLSDAHYHRGEACEDLGMPADAVSSYQEAARRRPAHVDAHHAAGMLLQSLGRNEEAGLWWQRPQQQAADDGARVRALLATPTIFQTAEHMNMQRQQMEASLTYLEGRDLSIADPLVQVNSTNFYAAYHGRDDRSLQTRLANLYARATPTLRYVARHCEEGARPAQPLRVGFISSFFRMHTIGEVNLGFIRHLSRDVCRVVLLQPPSGEDNIARLIRGSADEVVVLPTELTSARQAIAEQRLDVLFYTDIGMDPFTYFLAFARLAPVQVTTWGHPDTTGIPTLDYYVSGVDLEPPDADQHYSERLVRLSGLPTYYFAPAFFGPARSRSHFGLEEKDHLYLCTQAPFKVHPDFDALLGDILRADPLGRVLFIRSQNPHWTHELLRRFHRTLPGLVERIQFLPHQGGQDYLHLLAACDVLLDTTHFGGGNTHFKAFSVAAPVVTLPGAFARSRVATACYRKMGLLDCIATDRADYVRIAVRLGTDPEWRQEIRSQIAARRSVLYEDPAILRELERFFIEALSTSPFPAVS